MRGPFSYPLMAPAKKPAGSSFCLKSPQNGGLSCCAPLTPIQQGETRDLPLTAGPIVLCSVVVGFKISYVRLSSGRHSIFSESQSEAPIIPVPDLHESSKLAVLQPQVLSGLGPKRWLSFCFPTEKGTEASKETHTVHTPISCFPSHIMVP